MIYQKKNIVVKGKNSDNKFYREKVKLETNQFLIKGLTKIYFWIKSQVDILELETKWIYESPDGGTTVFKREPMSTERIKIK